MLHTVAIYGPADVDKMSWLELAFVICHAQQLLSDLVQATEVGVVFAKQHLPKIAVVASSMTVCSHVMGGCALLSAFLSLVAVAPALMTIVC